MLSVSDRFESSSVYVGDKATETAFKLNAGGQDILHLATHAVTDSDSPMNSRIFLSADETNDGLLTVSDLYRIETNANIVVLSACETGRGTLENGDELIGLVRGFLFSGSSSIVASLWQVDDEATREFMLRFYEALLQDGYSLGEALRKAKFDLSQDVRWAHPVYWAPFVLYGLPGLPGEDSLEEKTEESI